MLSGEVIPHGHQKCSKCGQVKPLEDFPPYYRFWHRDHMRMPDCWDCRFEAALSRMGTVKKNPVMAFVRAAVNAALKHGLLEKAGTCKYCGSHHRVRMHHPNYRRPLQVEYICNDCHNNHHHYEHIANRLNGIQPEHYISTYFKRSTRRGKYTVRKSGCPLTPMPYKTAYRNPWGPK